MRSLTQFQQVEPERIRRIAEDMTMGDTTLELSGRHGVSPRRISQLRRELEKDWDAFTGQIA